MKKKLKIISILCLTFIVGITIGFIVSPYFRNELVLNDRPTKEAYYSNLDKVRQYEKNLMLDWPKTLDFKPVSYISSTKTLTELQEKSFNKDIQNEELFWKIKNAELQKIVLQLQIGDYSVDEYKHINKQIKC